MKGCCNKCSVRVKDMNGLEIEDFIRCGSFICSNCINKEMELEK